MKIGNVYKLICDEHELVGVLVSKRLREWDGLDEVTFITTAGREEKIVMRGKEKIVSPRLSGEVRDQLKLVKKEWDKFYALKEKIERLEDELRGQRSVLKEAEQKLAVVSDEFDPNTFRNYPHINRYSTSKDNPEFSVSVLKEIDKYASPEQYDFLFREYDNNIFIRSSEDCINEFKLTIPKYKIEQLIEQLTFLKFEGVEGECSLEDKDTLMVGEVLKFAYPKKASRSDMLRELEIVSEWAKREGNNL